MGISVNPVILSVGPFLLTWQGFFTGLAVVAALAAAAGSLHRHGFATNLACDIVIWVIPPALVGARLFHVLDSWNYYSFHPTEIVALGQGGASLPGAWVVGAAAAFLFARRRRLPVGVFFDALVLPVVLGLATGRVGDFLTGAYQGRPTGLPVGIVYLHPSSYDHHRVPVHPAALYEIGWDALIVGLVFAVRRLRPPAGVRSCLFAVLWGVGQVGIGFTRELPPDVMGLGQAQIIGAVVAVVGGLIMGLILWRERMRSARSPAARGALAHPG